MITKAGEIFGIRSFFTDEPRENSIRSRNFSTLFEIKQADFLKILKKYPSDYEKFLCIKDKIRLYSQYQSSQLQCICCSKKTHLYQQCPIIHFVPDRDFIIKRLLFSVTQERKDFTRRKRKKYNSRRNVTNVQGAILLLNSSVLSEDDYEESQTFEEGKNRQQAQQHITLPMSGTQQLIQIPSEPELEESKQEIQYDSSEYELSPCHRQKPMKMDDSSPSQKKSLFIKKFPSKEEQQLIEQPNEKKNDMKATSSFKNNVKVPTEENIPPPTGFTRFEDAVNSKPQSQTHLRRALSRKRITKIPDKEEKIEINPDKYREYEQNCMFFYDFERMKNHGDYFPHNNLGSILEKMIEKQVSPLSFGSRHSNKKKMEKRIRSSKFMIDFVNGVGRISKGSDSVKNDTVMITELFKNRRGPTSN